MLWGGEVLSVVGPAELEGEVGRLKLPLNPSLPRASMNGRAALLQVHKQVSTKRLLMNRNSSPSFQRFVGSQ